VTDDFRDGMALLTGRVFLRFLLGLPLISSFPRPAPEAWADVPSLQERERGFKEDVKIGTTLRRRTHFFDYQKRKWVSVRQRKDGTTVRAEEEIPLGMVYHDFITASYNFRYGVYGDIERGRKYSVASFPKKGPSSYEVRVASKELYPTQGTIKGVVFFGDVMGTLVKYTRT